MINIHKGMIKYDTLPRLRSLRTSSVLTIANCGCSWAYQFPGYMEETAMLLNGELRYSSPLGLKKVMQRFHAYFKLAGELRLLQLLALLGSLSAWLRLRCTVPFLTFAFCPSFPRVGVCCSCVCVRAQLHLALYGCKFLEDLIKAGENFLFRLHILK